MLAQYMSMGTNQYPRSNEENMNILNTNNTTIRGQQKEKINQKANESHTKGLGNETCYHCKGPQYKGVPKEEKIYACHWCR